MNLTCQFCGAPSTLLCDGRMPDGRTCDANMCELCAKNVSKIHCRLARAVNGSRCHWERIDLCPGCVKAGRTAGPITPRLSDMRPMEQAKLF